MAEANTEANIQIAILVGGSLLGYMLPSYRAAKLIFALFLRGNFPHKNVLQHGFLL